MGGFSKEHRNDPSPQTHTCDSVGHADGPQSPTVASKVRWDRSGCLVYVGEPKGEMFESLRELVGSDELLEMGVAFAPIKTTPPSFAGLSGDLGLSPDSVWALTDAKGRRLLQGGAPPSAETVLNALEETNEAEAVVDALRQNPLWILFRPRVADIARECGKRSLARRWAGYRYRFA